MPFQSFRVFRLSPSWARKDPTPWWFTLFLISALGLFFELAVIRWLSGELRLFSYFKNFPLLAAFLGLAVGLALADRDRDYLGVFPLLLASFVILVLAVGRTASPRLLAYPARGEEFLWFTADISYWLSLGIFLGMVLIFFLLSVLLFIPLGQAIGREMKDRPAVLAYVINLVASLTGVWTFAFLSYLQTSPILWFGLGLLGLALYLLLRQGFALGTLLIGAATLFALLLTGQQQTWSPYQRLQVRKVFGDSRFYGPWTEMGYQLDVQQIFYQFAFDLSPESLQRLPTLEPLAVSYNLPYLLKPPGARVLILGAGMGNDVAAALRNGASSVQAVEIDPAIYTFGQDLHPEQPYSDPRVTVTIDDARSFFEETDERYDLISFGLLDSHTLLSGMTSVRLDSFVYTLESFRQVREHLVDDGKVVVSFAVGAPWIEERLGQMLRQVFGDDRVFVYYSDIWGTTFVAGSLTTDTLQRTGLTPWTPNPDLENIPISTDDWPYLYMRTQQVPTAYWQALFVMGAVALVVIGRSFPEALRPNWHFFLLGAGFLLIEFKSITEFALLFGTTWLVNALAISGVLLMALAANLVVLWRKRIDVRLAYLLLFLSLAVAYLFPLGNLGSLPPMPRALSAMILLSLPLFFSGLIFSESLRKAGEAAGPLASNLTGSVVGGALEYTSLMWGIKNMYLVGFVVYVGALLAWIRQERG
jgi:hypothetical protein